MAMGEMLCKISHNNYRQRTAEEEYFRKIRGDDIIF